MSSRGESNYASDDAPRIVRHRLQQTAGQAVEPNTRADQLHGSANSAPSAGQTRSSGVRDGSPLIDKKSVRAGNSRRQIVLVDKEIDAFRDIAIALRDEYDFHITISGNEALSLLKAGGIDTIVVGQTLYSSTGLNVLAAARRNAPHTHRVLLANAVEASGVTASGSDAEPFRMLARPCTLDKLRDLLETIDEPQLEAVPRSPAPAPTLRKRPIAPARSERDEIEHVVMETPSGRPSRRANAAPATIGPMPIVVYTDDGDFYHALCNALQDHHDIQLATQIERVVELAEMGACPVLITDRAGTQSELQRISIAVRAVEGASVTIAAGSMQDGHALRKLMGTGALHSFLPKPLSIPLVRLAVESAKRQYLQQKFPASTTPDSLEAEATPTATVSLASKYANAAKPTTTYKPYVPMDFTAVETPGRGLSIDGFQYSQILSAIPRIAALTFSILVLAALGYFGWRYYESFNSSSAAIEANLRSAEMAYESGRIVSPTDASAVYFYDKVLQTKPSDARAIAGREKAVERLVEQIEQALVDERLDEAAENSLRSARFSQIIAALTTLQRNWPRAVATKRMPNALLSQASNDHVRPSLNRVRLMQQHARRRR